jgi:hypothetical protein
MNLLAWVLLVASCMHSSINCVNSGAELMQLMIVYDPGSRTPENQKWGVVPGVKNPGAAPGVRVPRLNDRKVL